MRRLLLLTCCCALQAGMAAAAGDGQLFKPHGEVNFQLGNQRNIMMTQMFMPLAQADDALFYGDLRLMGDSESDTEGNAGVGYRKLLAGQGAVAGVHGWLDRRHTDLGSNFYQTTLGGEWLTEKYEARLNAYLPLTGSKYYQTGSIRDPYLAGAGLYVNQLGVQIEEPQPGLDAELGVPIPAAQKHIDNLRAYYGVYHFFGDKTPGTTGWRTRIAADITPDFRLGARYQHDGQRGSQGFLEATLRFPFTYKKATTDGLRALMDETPERDIDIVSNAKTLDSGLRPVINTASGAPQQMITVDNTAAAGGDGSVARPFNTLAAAQGAANANAIIYVRQGSGTAGMDSGITLDKSGETLMGSGVDFNWDGGRFALAGQSYTPGSLLIAPATTAPTLTNTTAGGDGVRVAADNVTVAGIEVNGASNNGIVVEATGSGSAQNTRIINDASLNNGNMGLYVHGADGANVSAMAQGVITTGNGTHGMGIHDDTTGTFDVDLGGGDQGSLGRNVLTGNTLEDLAVNNGGRQLAAQNNWWGQAGGPNAGDATLGIKPQVYLGSPLDAHLAGNWTFDSTWMNGTTVYDRSANHNDGTAFNGASSVTGEYGDAMHFDGIDQYAVMSGAYPGGNTARTLSMWVNSDDTVFDANADHIVGYGNATTLQAFGNMIHTGNTWAFYAHGADYHTATPVTTGWNLHTITFDGTTMNYYLDGVLIGTETATLNTATGNMTFGVRPDLLNGNFFNGAVDDVRIYTTAMTADQVGQLYRSTNTSTVDSTGALTSAP